MDTILLKRRFPKSLVKYWPIVAILAALVIFFYPVFFKKLVPIPGDFIVGTYFPWLDYKWGYSVGVPVKNPVTSDVVSIIYPLRSYAIDILKTGSLPLWNPFMFTGIPLLGDFQVGVFSPTVFFYFILPKVWAWTAQIIFQPALAIISCYLLLRNWGLRKIESLFAGLFFAFSSFNIVWMEWNTSTLAAAFIPLIFLCFDKFIKTGRLMWGALLSIVVGLQIFSGYPQLVIFTILFLCLFILFRLDEMSKSKIFAIIIFITLGALLSSVVSVPASELILNSQRNYGILDHDLIYFPWESLITFLAPDYFGNSATYNYFGDGNYAINVGYSGLIVLFLAVIGVFKNWKKTEVKFLGASFLIALLFALPTPLGKALFNSPIPGISLSSNTRILVFANLSLAILAAYGVSTLLKKEKIRNIFIFTFPLVISLLAIFTLTYFFGVNKSVSLRNMILPIALAVSGSLLIYIREKLYANKVLRYLTVLTICLIAVFELFRYGWKFTPFSSPDFVFPKTPALDFFDDKKDIFRISTGNATPMNMWVPYKLESVSGYDAAYPARWAEFLSAIRGGDLDSPSYSYYAPFDLYFSPWFDLLNNKYLFVMDPSKTHDMSNPNLIYQVEKDLKFEKIFQDRSLIIYENKNVLPRAFLVSDWEYIPDKKTLTVLADPNFPVREKILIDTPIKLINSQEVNGTVFFEKYSPEESVINVSTDKDALLFVSDAWYPGWNVKIDGKKSNLYKADYVFRAVLIPAGTHKVEFYFVQKSLAVGKAVSLVSLVLIITLFTFERKLTLWIDKRNNRNIIA